MSMIIQVLLTTAQAYAPAIELGAAVFLAVAFGLAVLMPILGIARAVMPRQ